MTATNKKTPMAMAWGRNGRYQDFCMEAILLNTLFPAVKKGSFFGALDYFRGEPNLLLQDVKSPDKSGIPLFRAFSDVDLAAILRQFEAFRDKKLNTLQKRISDCGWEIKVNDPRVVKMQEALIEFFYGTDTRP